MRILHVSHALPPDGITGVENYTDHLARAQAGAGHTVTAWARGPRTDVLAGTIERTDAGGYEQIRSHFGPGHQFVHTRRRWDMATRFHAFVAEWKPDLVHFQSLIYHDLSYPQIARRAGAATVLTLHDLWFTCPTVQRVDFRGDLCRRPPGRGCLPCVWGGRRETMLPREKVAALSRLPVAASLLDLAPTCDDLTPWQADSQACLSDVDLVISPSRFVADDLTDYGVTHPNLQILDYGIARPEPAPRDRPALPLHFGVIGTHAKKGAEVAVASFRTLSDLPVTLTWYGVDGDGPPDLPANVALGGRFAHDELERVYGSFDVLIVPSLWWENAPFVIREAFARGLPVIASDLGGMAESVHNGVDGLLFPVGDKDALAACVRRLALDPALLETLREGVRPPTYFDQHLADLEGLYQSVRPGAGEGAA